MESPIIECPSLIDDCQVFIKREDLLPFSFGGNKYRIALEFFSDMEEKGKDAIIGYGSPSSNLCRVIANIAYARNVPCFIVSPEKPGELTQTYNNEITQLCKATVVKCCTNKISDTIESVILNCKSKGLKPYYINGDKFGKGNEAVQLRAYYKVYSEIISQVGVAFFDYIFLPVGTGMTYGGLFAGKHTNGGTENIVGISIARSSEKETLIIQNMINASLGQNIVCSENSIKIDDTYLCGGYGKYNEEVIHTIHSVMQNFGIPMDTIYTGKAFHGMLDYIKKNSIRGKILFVHTGGTPLFFDDLNKINYNGS